VSASARSGSGARVRARRPSSQAPSRSRDDRRSSRFGTRSSAGLWTTRRRHRRSRRSTRPAARASASPAARSRARRSRAQ